MKKIFVLAIMCLLSCTVSAGETTYNYTNYGGCTLVTRHSTNWLGGKSTGYGLAKDGIEILSPTCEVWYDEALRILTFRACTDDAAQQYHLWMFSADTGKKIYDGVFYAASSGDNVPEITFENKGKYRNAVVHYYNNGYIGYGPKFKTVGNFFRKDGKLYQVKVKQVKYEAPVE